MTLNILFFTITISKRKTTEKEYLQQQLVEKLYEEQKDLHAKMHRHL